MYGDIFIVFLFFAFPEYYNDPLSGAGNSLLLLNRPSAVFHNPALIGDASEVSFNYARPFDLPELHQAQVSFQIEGFGFGAQTLRSGGYAENRLIIGKSLSGRDLRAGIALGAEDLTAGPDRIAALSLNLGFAFESFESKIANSLHFTGVRIAGARDLFSPAMTLSFKYKGSGDINLYLDLFQEAGFPLGLRSGCSVKVGLMKVLFGISSVPDCYVLAFSLATRPAFGYRLRVHPYLGATHCFGVAVRM